MLYISKFPTPFLSIQWKKIRNATKHLVHIAKRQILIKIFFHLFTLVIIT